MDDPLDFVDFDDVLQHGTPSRWKYLGEKPGSGMPANSPDAPPGTLKIYEFYRDEFGKEIEIHYFRHPDGTVSGVRTKPRS